MRQVYESTDWVIDTINAHPEWGVHVQYATASEYLQAIKKADVPLPVKARGTGHLDSNGEGDTFFPCAAASTRVERPGWAGPAQIS